MRFRVVRNSITENFVSSLVLHLATIDRLRQSKTQYGIICLDCNQEVVHVCPSLSQHNQPLSTFVDATVLQADPTAQENLFSEYMIEGSCSTSLDSPTSVQLPSSSSSSISSAFTSHSTNSYPPTSATLGDPGYCPAGLQTQLPSSKDSFPLLATISAAPESTLVSPSASEYATSEEDSDEFTSEEESEAYWSTTNDNEANKTFDTSRLLDVGRQICCLELSNDGNYLAVGLVDHGTTIIYDMQTGQKTWFVCDSFSPPDNADCLSTLKEFVYGDDIHGKDNHISNVCFSPDSRYLVTRGLDTLLRVSLLIFLSLTVLSFNVSRYGKYPTSTSAMPSDLRLKVLILVSVSPLMAVSSPQVHVIAAALKFGTGAMVPERFSKL